MEQSKTCSYLGDSTKLYIMRINDGARVRIRVRGGEKERKLREYRFPCCRRTVATVNFDYHLPKVFRESIDRGRGGVRPGLWPFEISAAGGCTGVGSPQDLPS